MTSHFKWEQGQQNKEVAMESDEMVMAELLEKSGFNVIRIGVVPVYLSPNPILNWATNIGINMIEPKTFTRTLFVHAK